MHRKIEMTTISQRFMHNLTMWTDVLLCQPFEQHQMRNDTKGTIWLRNSLSILEQDHTIHLSIFTQWIASVPKLAILYTQDPSSLVTLNKAISSDLSENSKTLIIMRLREHEMLGSMVPCCSIPQEFKLEIRFQGRASGQLERGWAVSQNESVPLTWLP